MALAPVRACDGGAAFLATQRRGAAAQWTGRSAVDAARILEDGIV
jgi:hypothetical protein